MQGENIEVCKERDTLLDKTILQNDEIETIKRQLEQKVALESQLRNDLGRFRRMQERLREELDIYNKEQEQLRKELAFYQQEHKESLLYLYQNGKIRQQLQESQHLNQPQFRTQSNRDCTDAPAATGKPTTPSESLEAKPTYLTQPLAKSRSNGAVESSSKAIESNTNLDSIMFAKIPQELDMIKKDMESLRATINGATGALADDFSSTSSSSISQLSESECSSIHSLNHRNNLIHPDGEEIEVLFSNQKAKNCSVDRILRGLTPTEEVGTENNEHRQIGVAKQELEGIFGVAKCLQLERDSLREEKNELQVKVEEHWSKLVSVEKQLKQALNREIDLKKEISMKKTSDADSKQSEGMAEEKETQSSESVLKKRKKPTPETLKSVHQNVRDASRALIGLLGNETQPRPEAEADGESASPPVIDQTKQARETLIEFSEALVTMCRENLAASQSRIKILDGSMLPLSILPKKCGSSYSVSLASIEEGEGELDEDDVGNDQVPMQNPETDVNDSDLGSNAEGEEGSPVVADGGDGQQAGPAPVNQINSCKKGGRGPYSAPKPERNLEAGAMPRKRGDLKAVEVVYDDGDDTVDKEDHSDDLSGKEDSSSVPKVETQNAMVSDITTILHAPERIPIGTFLLLMSKGLDPSTWGSPSGWMLPKPHNRGN